MKEDLAKNKNDTKKRRMEKKKGTDIVEPVIIVESDEETEDDDSRDSYYDSLDDLYANLSGDDDDSIFNNDVINSDIEISVRATKLRQKGKKLYLLEEVRKLFLREKEREFN